MQLREHSRIGLARPTDADGNVYHARILPSVVVACHRSRHPSMRLSVRLSGGTEAVSSPLQCALATGTTWYSERTSEDELALADHLGERRW
jgi:hypothetical protein